MRKLEKTPLLLLGLFDTAIMTARCFRGTGIPIYGLDYQTSHSGFSSRIINSYKMPKPINEQNWLDFFVDWLKRFSYKFVIIPTSDEFIFLTAKYADILSKFAFFLLPSFTEIKRIIQRDLQFEAVRQCGISVPKFVKGPITNIDNIHLHYPLAVKPINTLEWKKRFNNKGFVINCREELERVLLIVNKLSVNYLIQEIIEGDIKNNYEVNSLYFPNGSFMSHTVRKLRQFPPDFGTATCIESNLNIEVSQLAERHIKENSIYGFSNIEFKYDTLTGTYYYIENNPRVWLQVNFSAAIGYNFPLAYYRYLTGDTIESFPSIMSTGKWVDHAPDFLYYIRYRRKKKLRLKCFLKDWLFAKSTGLLSIRDPLPILKEYQFGLRLLKRKKKGL